ncbi:MAG: YaiI/YqxD family protein [Myxococcota bacterium]|nr:YaiI/YqxD family protein [Myxococcota bacterium]
MKIWIDADACPKPVKEIVLRASERRQVPVTFVANQFIPTPNVDWITSVQVPQGMDVADNYIVQHLSPEDLVVTQDVPLAAEVVEKGAMAISNHGVTWTEENVREKLSLRDFFTEAREAGIMTGGPTPYDNKAKQAFANALDRWLTAVLNP